MKPAIEFLQCRQESDRDCIYQRVFKLWEDCFADDREYIWEFCHDMPLYGAVLAMDGEKAAGMALLLQPDASIVAYYGYGVCTHPAYRGQGICRKIHEKIRMICEKNRAGYFVRPAARELTELYQKLGLQTLLWEDERIMTTGEVYSHMLLSPEEYAEIRRKYYPAGCHWDADAIRFMCRHGYTAAGFSLNGTTCAAFLSEEERIVCEICAPEHLLERAAVYAASALGGQAMVRFPGDKQCGHDAVMGYGVQENFYFNLYLE